MEAFNRIKDILVWVVLGQEGLYSIEKNIVCYGIKKAVSVSISHRSDGELAICSIFSASTTHEMVSKPQVVQLHIIVFIAGGLGTIYYIQVFWLLLPTWIRRSATENVVRRLANE